MLPLQAGYVGDDVESILYKLLQSCSYNLAGRAARHRVHRRGAADALLTLPVLCPPSPALTPLDLKGNPCKIRLGMAQTSLGCTPMTGNRLWIAGV